VRRLVEDASCIATLRYVAARLGLTLHIALGMGTVLRIEDSFMRFAIGLVPATTPASTVVAAFALALATALHASSGR